MDRVRSLAAHGGVTSYENVMARCKPDHWAKTERDRRAGLLDRGATLTGPPKPDHADQPDQPLGKQYWPKRSR